MGMMNHHQLKALRILARAVEQIEVLDLELAEHGHDGWLESLSGNASDVAYDWATGRGLDPLGGLEVAPPLKSKVWIRAMRGGTVVAEFDMVGVAQVRDHLKVAGIKCDALVIGGELNGPLNLP